MRSSLLYKAAAICIAAALAPAAYADTVSSGPVSAVVPSGNAQPQRRATPDQIAPKETFSASELLSASRAPTTQRPSAPLAPPAFQLNFNGTDQTQGLRPPDTHGAVGATQFVEVTNSKFEVFNKLTGAKTKTVTLNSFCNYTPTTLFDPRIVYDKVWNRWVLVVDAFHETSIKQIICLAISTSSDATGGFFIYRFEAPRGTNTNFYDYPMLGMDQDAVIVTANIFNSDDVYQFSNLFGVAKADLYNGRGFSVPVFSTGASGTIAPPIVDSNDSVVMVLSRPSSGNTLALRKFTNLGRSGASFLSTTNVSVTSFTSSLSAGQFGTSDLLDVLNRFQDHSTQIRNHVINISTVRLSCGIESSCPTPRWWQINGGTNSQVASGLVFESGNSHDFNPAIAGSAIGGTASNPIGRMFFTWTATLPGSPPGSGHNARVKGSGRLATDATNIGGGSTLFTSTTFYNPSGDLVERWGDYSSVTIDPTAAAGCPVGNRAYIVNEKNNSTSLWGSRFGRFGFC